ncbi:MAG: Cell division protein MraZ [Ignavibacteriae bacterium]|nr:MAG: Cell division protein MraZ [Ignavibacteriota bacterium]
MASFKGTYKYSVDNKGRINIPAKMRKQLSDDSKDHFVITRGLDKCLFLYPHDVWLKVEEKLQSLSEFNSDHRYLERQIYSIAEDVVLDVQARIIIPSELREYAQIKNEVLIIGVSNRIEIWNPKVYEEYLNNRTSSYEDVAERVMTNLK